MHVTGKYLNASFSLDGTLLLTFQINEKLKALEEVEAIETAEKLTIEAKKYREKRSITANAYFWQLVDKMAKVLRCDKWDVYLMQLHKYGVFVDMQVIKEALPVLREKFRFVEEFNDGYEQGEYITARCYFGSSKYNTEEMSHLINGTVDDAKDLRIETLTDDEIRHIISVWEAGK